MGHAHTKYANLTNAELLVQIDSIRDKSPIIEELAHRLEQGVGIDDESGHNVTCPVCEAQLEADYDSGNDMFTLQLGDR